MEEENEKKKIKLWDYSIMYTESFYEKFLVDKN